MTNDDLGALAAVAVGAIIAIAATVTYLETEPVPFEAAPAPVSPWPSTLLVSTSLVPLTSTGTKVIMAGPETVRTGWIPTPDPLSHRR